MAKQRLTLQALTGLDNGIPAAVFQEELKKCVKDCADRPGLQVAREVFLRVSIKPGHNAAGICELANVTFEVKAKIPVATTRAYEMELDSRGELLFNPASPDDVNQRTLDEARD